MATIDLLAPLLCEELMEVRPGDLAALAGRVQARMREADDAVRRLLRDGWEVSRDHETVYLDHPELDSPEEVELRLAVLGISPDLVSVCDGEDDEPPFDFDGLQGAVEE